MIKEFMQDVAEAFAELNYIPEEGFVNIGDLFDSAMNTLLHTQDLGDAKRVLAYLNFCLGCQDDITDLYDGNTEEMDRLREQFANDYDAVSGAKRSSIKLVSDNSTRDVFFVTNAIMDDEGAMYCIFHSENESDEIDLDNLDDLEPFENFRNKFPQDAPTASLDAPNSASPIMTADWNTLLSAGQTLSSSKEDEFFIVPSTWSPDKIKMHTPDGNYLLEYDYEYHGININGSDCPYSIVCNDDTLEVYDSQYTYCLKSGEKPDKHRMIARIRWCITDWQEVTGVAKIEFMNDPAFVDQDFFILLAASCLIMYKRISER